MFGRDLTYVWAYNSTQLMPFHTTYMTIILMGLVYTSHFIVSPQYYSTFDGSMRFSFIGNLNDYYHKFHGIRIPSTITSLSMGLGSIAFASKLDPIGREW